MEDTQLEYAHAIKQLVRYFSNTTAGALLFAVSDDIILQKQINERIHFLLMAKNKNVSVFSWRNKKEIHPVVQLQNFVAAQTDLAGLIFTDIDAGLASNPNLLIQLNFSREAILELKIPILIWLSSTTLTQISQQAIDIYNQRIGANLYFTANVENKDIVNQLEEYKLFDIVHNNLNIRYLNEHINLLKEQLETAEATKNEPTEIANTLVISLLGIYIKIPEAENFVQLLLTKYLPYMDFDNPHICFGIAEVYYYLNQFDEAEKIYLQASVLFEQDRTKFSVEMYQSQMASIQNNLATIYKEKKELEKAEIAYEKALKLLRSLVEKKPTVFFVYALAKNLHNLGLLYASVQKMAQAEVIYQEALRIFRGLAAENPDTFLCDVANTLNGLGNYYSTNTKIPQAEAAFQEALGIYRNLATKNPDIFLPHLAETLIRLGTFYARNKNIAEAEAVYLEAETLSRELIYTGSKKMLHSFIILLTNLATFYSQTFPNKEKSVAYSNEVISLASPLVATMPEMKEYIETVTKYI